MNCSSCAAELPSLKFKFCPFCGAVVSAVRASVPSRTAAEAVVLGRDTIADPMPAVNFAGRPAARTPTPAATDTMPEPAAAVRAMEPEAAQVSAFSGKPTRSRVPDSEAATVFEMPALDSATIAAAMKKKRESHQNMARPLSTGELASANAAPRLAPEPLSGARATDLRSATSVKPRGATPPTDDDRPTAVNLPAITDADLPPISASAKRGAIPNAAPKAVTPRVGGKTPAPTVATSAVAAKTKKKFSETAWFLAAVDPSQLADADTAASFDVDSEALTNRYVPPQPLSDEVRRDFSLGTSEDPASAPKKAALNH